jgi:hypothetical protein
MIENLVRNGKTATFGAASAIIIVCGWIGVEVPLSTAAEIAAVGGVVIGLVHKIIKSRK